MTDKEIPSVQLGEQCRSLLEHLLDAVLLVDADSGKILYVNDAAARIHGRDRSEMIGMTLPSLLAPEEFALWEGSVTRQGAITGEGLAFEATHMRGDGTTFPVEVHARLGDFGGRHAVFAIVRDIAARKETERKLAQAIAELEQVFETAADGMRIIDRDYRVLRANRTLREMSGSRVNHIEGHACFESFPGSLCNTEGCPLVRILDGEERIEVEVEKLKADGTTISCILTAQPFKVDGEIVGIVEDFKDISERKRAEELAKHLATHDSLTDLPNRLLFSDRLAVALAQTERGGSTPALIFADIDDFKSVNDTHGHRIGDLVLAAVARRLRQLVRKSDTVARLGGDEFVLLLSSISDRDQAGRVAEKALEVMREPIRLAALSIPVSISMGVALLSPDDSADTLLMRADAAMYRVKAEGGNGVAFDGDRS
jgi:diguanylate cyclase (GGDEF)-like protein/PAS domain S-box-containing protein